MRRPSFVSHGIKAASYFILFYSPLVDPPLMYGVCNNVYQWNNFSSFLSRRTVAGNLTVLTACFCYSTTHAWFAWKLSHRRFAKHSTSRRVLRAPKTWTTTAVVSTLKCVCKKEGARERKRERKRETDVGRA